MPKIIRIMAVLSVVGVAVVATITTNFVVVDRAYGRLSAGAVLTRQDVEQRIKPLRRRKVVDRREIAPNLATAKRAEDAYVRYVLFGSKHGIDVVYDKDERVRFIWPEYE